MALPPQVLATLGLPSEAAIEAIEEKVGLLDTPFLGAIYSPEGKDTLLQVARGVYVELAYFSKPIAFEILTPIEKVTLWRYHQFTYDGKVIAELLEIPEFVED